jgi:hypothetical protein
LGIQERVLQRLVKRGADGKQHPPSMRSELEASPTSKHVESISLFLRYVNIYFRFLFASGPFRAPVFSTP